MKKMNTVFIKNKFAKLFVCFAAGVCFSGFAFDWPQNAVLSDSFFSYFGQNRGGGISSSLIFSDFSPVKASDKGKVVAVIAEHDDDMGWFESPLGNAVIVEHPDKLMTVYGNLDGETFTDDFFSLSEVETGTPLGVSGNSGWQQGSSCLEFQVIDLEQNSSVNPRVLMPREGQEMELQVGAVSAVARNGTVYPVWNQMTLPAGQYSFYRSRQKTTIPYKTSVSINGALVERIVYDRLKQSDKKLCVSGNGLYSVEQVYPDKEKQLLSVVNISSGKNILTVSVSDILGAEIVAEYVIFVK